MNTTLQTPTTRAHWLARWRRLADVIMGLTDDDPRYPAVMALLQDCERHERAANEAGFIRTATQIVTLMTLPTPPTLPMDIEPPQSATSRH